MSFFDVAPPAATLRPTAVWCWSDLMLYPALALQLADARLGTVPGYFHTRLAALYPNKPTPGLLGPPALGSGWG